MVTLLARLASGDPLAYAHVISQIRVHLQAIAAAETAIKAIEVQYAERLAAGQPAMTDEERDAAIAQIDANTAAINAAANLQ